MLLFHLFFIMLCVHDSLMTFHYYRNGFRQHYFDSIRNIGKNISPPVIEPLIKMAFTTVCVMAWFCHWFKLQVGIENRS